VGGAPYDTLTNARRSIATGSTEPTKDAEGDRGTVDRLMADLSVLATDMEQVLKATASQTGQQVTQVRAKAEESLKTARARVAEFKLQGAALAKTRAAGRATDHYVRANPWQVMAICGVVGLVLGIWLRATENRIRCI
jgi:ElaB/YqjD/DUF883 family membrane-anchored ribosome-binding protein